MEVPVQLSMSLIKQFKAIGYKRSLLELVLMNVNEYT